LETGSGKTYAARSVIIATGAAAKWLGLESETKLRGHGVSACATCDAAFFRDQRVVVVGGGDSALEEALFLTRFAGHVTVVVRRDSLRASQIMQDRAQKNKKIDFLWNSEVLEINDPAAGRVTGVVIKNSQDNATSEFKTDGVFIAIGHQPNTAVFKGALKLDRVGYLVTTDIVKTSVEGVFAAGDVHDHRYRQAVTAAGFGCAAALEAQRWLEDQASNI
ncbi:MAG: thioredoxin-disulfide reductase, partial [Candidatus Buchananbacteria bacterium RIFCSPHIGHO2_02_FULL_56_16]